VSPKAIYGAALALLVLCACGSPAPKGQPTAPAPKDQPTAPAPAKQRKILPAAWPTFHGSLDLDGWADVPFPEKPVEVWRIDLGAPVLSPPIAQGDRIYAVDTHGGIHALDPNGHEVWSRRFTEPAPPGRPEQPMGFDAPLALFESTLVACSAGGRIYAMDPATGKSRWEVNADVPILGSPNLATVATDKGTEKRLVFIDQTVGALHALDFADGRALWQGKVIARCDASPAVNGEIVGFGSCAGALHLFSAKTGEMLREVTIDEDSQIAGGVVFLDGRVYASTRSGKFICANVETAQPVWVNSDCEDEALQTPAVHGDTVVFTANDGVVYCLERETGKLRWREKLRGQPSSPVLVGDKVAVTSRGTLYLLRASDGQRLWSSEVSDEITAPIMAGALLIVGSKDGSLVAFGEE
jgi:outer membrane protein assembly factor BamB